MCTSKKCIATTTALMVVAVVRLLLLSFVFLFSEYKSFSYTLKFYIQMNVLLLCQYQPLIRNVLNSFAETAKPRDFFVVLLLLCETFYSQSTIFIVIILGLEWCKMYVCACVCSSSKFCQALG